MLREILNWVGRKVGEARGNQLDGTRRFESLEPRVLLSADLANVQPAPSATSIDAAIYVDLDQQDPTEPERSSPLLVLDASPCAQPSQTQSGARAVGLFGVSPALFVENQGQWSDPSVRYVHDGAGIDVAMTDAGVVFRAADADLQMLQFTASFIGANAVRPVGLQPSDSLFNYYLGDPARWRQNVASYEIVAYEGLYEGVDLQIQGLRSHVKYEFHVAPGADYSRIAVHYEGIEGLSIAEDGSLQVDLAAGRGVIRDDAPYIYQEIDGQKVTVAGRFILLDNRTYSFEITGPIDPDHALVIDPDLVWSTYLGGSRDDYGFGIAVEASGSVYVTGATQSSGWTRDGFEADYGGVQDAFVVKLSANGQHLWSTYLGGNSSDTGARLAVDAAGNVYVTGTTQSSGWTSGGFDTDYGGGQDAFVAKLSASGQYVWSTYLGGTGDDPGRGIAVDGSGNVYVTGTTNSSSGWISGGFDTDYHGGPHDAFVAKLSASGAHLWCTYLGGDNDDITFGLTTDGAGSVYVTGATQSANWMSNGFDVTYGGGQDAFVVKLSAGGVPVWSTYLGGSSSDSGNGITVDASGSVYVTGTTYSSDWTNGGFDLTYHGGGDAFVAKLNADGASLLWGIRLGDSDRDEGIGIAVDAFANVYVAGYTESSGWTSGGFDTSYNDIGGTFGDAFVAALNSGGARLWSTYLGGSNWDWGFGIAVDSSRNVYVTGYTDSAGWTSGGFDTTHNGRIDAFVAKLADTTPPIPYPSTWAAAPCASSSTSIRMVATTATDVSGVEYYFHETTGNPGATDSGWQVSNVYEDTGLMPGTAYTYQVKTRDKSVSSNEGAYSDSASATTPKPLYRFWSPTLKRHFYTIQEGEKNKLIKDYPDVWTYEMVAYYALAGTTDANAAPVYRFWSDKLRAHFYTISSAERDKLNTKFSDVWTYEGVAFYTYVPGAQPVGTSAIYRFWSDTLQTHFYTIKAAERDKLIAGYSDVWTYELIAWYAYGV